MILVSLLWSILLNLNEIWWEKSSVCSVKVACWKGGADCICCFKVGSVVQSWADPEDESQLLRQHYPVNASPTHKESVCVFYPPLILWHFYLHCFLLWLYLSSTVESGWCVSTCHEKSISCLLFGVWWLMSAGGGEFWGSAASASCELLQWNEWLVTLVNLSPAEELLRRDTASAVGGVMG